ncbi:MAG: tetratricopeptide repeat protein [Saprospiraceae bacterium]|nr:tetratricopeptide repeat protein [Saprospiraceae bacterium]
MILQLNLTPEQAQSLQTIAGQFNRELEANNFPNAATLQQLKTALQEALWAQAGFAKFWEAAKVDHNLNSLCLVHERTAIRNLPWQLATEENQELSIYKAIKPDLPNHQASLGEPLKILFMVATPAGVTQLNFEQEEKKLLLALLPLMGKGLVQVHFTNNGSLEDLEEKLLENKFHVLHFSGHGSYRNGKGTLALEAPLTGELKEADVDTLTDLFDRLNKKGRRPDLVVLSACQTAQGESGELAGIADALIRENIPAVIAMASSVLDDCAAHFTTAFYDFLSQGLPLPDAFQKATKAMRAFEVQRYKPAENRLPNGQFLASGQWLIPQLVMSQQVQQLVDKTAERSELAFTFDDAYLQKEENLLNFLKRHSNYVFAGRRKEIQLAFQALKNKKNVLLKGQGGVGKTALAEHLAIRLLASNPRTKVFTHSEKTPAAQSLLDQMQEYLTKDKQQFSVVSELALIEKLDEQVSYLLKQVSQHCHPFFIFDNVETFQIYDKDKSIWIWNVDKHEDVLTALQTLNNSLLHPFIIITGRYPLVELVSLEECNLNTVPFGDFIKKCWQLSFSTLADALEKDKLSVGTLKRTGEGKTTFEAVVKLLHTTLGGNYRALEFFDELYAREKDQIVALLDKLDQLKDDPTLQDEVLHRMSENLVFEQLLRYLNAEDQDTLSLLARFRIPVLPMAVGMQRETADRSRALAQLTNLTLVEQQTGIDGRNRYYVTPLVGELLKRNHFIEAPFSADNAGAYHEYIHDEDLYLNWLDELSEAFEWYFEAQKVDGVNRIGYRLNNFYYNVQQFRLSLEYGLRSEEVAQEQTYGNIWNNLGLTLQIFGQLEPALHYYEKSLAYDKGIDDRKREGIMLNNISQIYLIKGNFDVAMSYLQKAITVFQENNDLELKGKVLISISEIHRLKGDYDLALNYLKQSINIFQETGDREGEGTALNNISQVYMNIADYDQTLFYLKQSFEIIREIGDRLKEGTILMNISKVYDAQKDFQTALDYLHQSLVIRKEIGDKQGEGATLNDIGLNYLGRGEYDIALSYCQEALTISKKINDPLSESISLGNIAKIFQMQGKHEHAYPLLQKALEISQAIGDLPGAAVILWNIGDLLFEQEQFEKAVIPIFKAYLFFNNVGSTKTQNVLSYLNAIIEQIGEARVLEIIEQMNQG